mmetsp:Transcript_1761/g.3083  ORF Transcript_1761/g.3083 Transcript_1761/m.3083 type:complete len:389 (-) Transcript_1761:267-1433(-)
MASLVEEHPPAETLYRPPDEEEETPKKKSKKRDGSTLRKAPQAPKRFKSSYICFFMAKQPEIKEALGDKASVTEVSKRSAEMWRELPAEERAHWDDVAAKDKQRYMVEKASYTGPWQVPWKRAKKDPSAPKRPMSAFLYFSQDKRRRIKENNPSIRNTEVSRILGEMWRNASEDERRPHIEKEKEEREKYKVAIAKWREDYEKKMEDQRKQQAEQAAYMNNMYQGEQMPQPGPPLPPQNQDRGPYHHPHPPPPNYTESPQHGNYPPSYMPQNGAAPTSYGYGHRYPPHPPPPPPYSSYSQGQYGYANGKHVAVLAPSGMPMYPPSSYTSHGQAQGPLPPQAPPPPQQHTPQLHYDDSQHLSHPPPSHHHPYDHHHHHHHGEENAPHPA